MLRVCLVLAVLTVCQGWALHLKPNDDRRLEITGGLDADIKDFPFQVAIHNYDALHCGGTILNKEWILTAGHCVHDLEGDLSGLSVYAGSTSQLTGGQTQNVTWADVHPQFDARTLAFDAALMHLSGDLILDGILTRAVELVAVGQPITPGQPLTVSGWGRLTPQNTSVPEQLRAVLVPALPLDVCRQQYATRSLYVDETMVCAGFGGKDSCLGDSGGPLLDDQHVQVGVVSWAIGCGSTGYPGLYTNLAHPALRQWIDETTGDTTPRA